MFARLPDQFSFPEAEREVLAFWKEHDVFARSLAQRKGAERFVFYEGPPTANGLPHPGHCLTRTIKDLFPRYQTMCGRLVERKAGWDTHGLPVEVEVCKQIGIHSKEEIEEYGLEPFVHKCVESVWRYTREWEEMTNRLGFWINLDDAYATYHQSYVESVWWGLKTLFDRGLLYQGHKVVWWWAQGGTALSSGEVGEGYRDVDDPSVFVKFPLIESEPPAALRKLADGGLVSDVTDADSLLTHLLGTRRLPPSVRESFDTPEQTLRHIVEKSPGFLARLIAPTSLLVWTTTPWTLVSNHFAAVHPELRYALVHDAEQGENLYVAEDLVAAISKKVKRELEVLFVVSGADLLNLRYLPPYPEVYHEDLGHEQAELRGGGVNAIGWRVVAADFVTIDSGTGLVHEAPAFGEVDFEMLQQERQRFKEDDAIPLLCAVAPNGTFNDEAPEVYRGRWIKDCDKDINRELKERTTPWGTPLLYHLEQYRHSYPFCPRAEEDALIQYARKSWFVRTSRFKQRFIENNAAMTWLPEHIKEGRFGDFLRNNVDWALSRERYWGTPLPIWVCQESGQMEAVGSFDELLAKPGLTGTEVWEQARAARPDLPDDLRVHRPYIDALTYDSPFADGARMVRVREVIDCWWDAGSMPFAQWGFPHAEGSVQRFQEMFPASFISEAIDQTRGWFYGLLAISTLLFGPDESGRLAEPVRQALQRDGDEALGFPQPFEACIVLGHLMGEDGTKMSKRLKNYREPGYVFDTYGADALRWYLYSAQTPWTSVRFQENAIRDAQREFLVRLYNVFSFFNIYANIDGFDPRQKQARPAAERSELDRWILSDLNLAIRDVRGHLDRFENFPAAQRLNDFVDALSNWYVRRSRDRFWCAVSGEAARDQDKWDAYETLYEVLVTLSRAIAPFTPFFAETMHQNLVRDIEEGATDSVHLCAYPTPDAACIDVQLAEEMNLVRDLASLGRTARTLAKIRVRQPLERVEIILANHQHEDWLSGHAALIAEELNVKQVDFTSDADHYVHYEVKPNFKAIGPVYGRKAPQIAKALQALDNPADARRTLVADGKLTIEVAGETVALTPEQVEIRLQPREGWSAAQGRSGVVVLSTELSTGLQEEGLVRELIHHVQTLRKEHNLPYEARIALFVETAPELADVLGRWQETLAAETLAERVVFGPPEAAEAKEVSVEGTAVRLALAAPAVAG